MFTSFLDECKKLLKDKIIIMVLFIIPLCVNLMMGWELSGDIIKNIPMAILDNDNTELSRMICDYFKHDEFFNVAYFPTSEQEIESLINTDKIRTAMIIPQDFSNDVYTLKSPSLLMIYDGSFMSIASSAKAKASEILLTIKAGTAIKQIGARYSLPNDIAQKMALSLNFKNKMLYNPTKSFKNFLTPGFGIAIVQTGIVLVAVTSIVFAEIQNKRRKKIGHSLGKILFYTLAGSLSMLISILVQSLIFKVPFRGEYIDAYIMSLALSFAASAFAVMISSWLTNKIIALVLVGLFFIPSTVLAGYTWPLMEMPVFYNKLAYLIPFSRYAVNIRNIYLKGSGLNVMINDFLYLLMFGLICAIFSVIGVFVVKGERANEKI